MTDTRPTKKIGGKIFRKAGFVENKTTANKMMDGIRESGYHARCLPGKQNGKKGHWIFTRK